MEQPITFKFTTAEADLMVNALGTLPFNQSANLINNLQKQFSEQTAPPQETGETDKEETKK